MQRDRMGQAGFHLAGRLTLWASLLAKAVEDQSMAQFKVKLKKIADPDYGAAFLGAALEKPDKRPGARVVVFELTGFGIVNTVAIPVHVPSGEEDEIIRRARERLHAWLAWLAKETKPWRMKEPTA
jgi:hypothetical protein